MSESSGGGPLRIALVAEGVTDRIMIDAALRAILQERPYIMTLLQPEESDAFGGVGQNGGGWPGVYKWCHDAAAQGGGRLSGNRMLDGFDMLILHLDADVADKTYQSGNIAPLPSDGTLPCAGACPPPERTVDALRAVLLSWCGETAPPPHVALCTPSKSTETWVVSALFPHDAAVGALSSFECHCDPASRLGAQPARQRIRKGRPDYQARQKELTAAWPRVAGTGGLSQAARFQSEFLATLP